MVCRHGRQAYRQGWEATYREPAGGKGRQAGRKKGRQEGWHRHKAGEAAGKAVGRCVYVRQAGIRARAGKGRNQVVGRVAWRAYRKGREAGEMVVVVGRGERGERQGRWWW